MIPACSGLTSLARLNRNVPVVDAQIEVVNLNVASYLRCRRVGQSTSLAPLVRTVAWVPRGPLDDHDPQFSPLRWYKSLMNLQDAKIARKRLEWVDHARAGILRAVGDDIVSTNFQVFPTVDPIKFILKIQLIRPLGKDTRKPLRKYIRCWAKEWDCDLPRIDIDNKKITAEVFTKRRHYRRDAKGKFTGKTHGGPR